MAKRPSTFAPERTKDDLINRNLDRIRNEFEALADDCVLVTRLRADLGLTTTTQRVYHGLGRAVRGWIPVRVSANAAIYEGAASDAPAEYINLLASGTVTATVLFF